MKHHSAISVTVLLAATAVIWVWRQGGSKGGQPQPAFPVASDGDELLDTHADGDPPRPRLTADAVDEPAREDVEATEAAQSVATVDHVPDHPKRREGNPLFDKEPFGSFVPLWVEQYRDKSSEELTARAREIERAVHEDTKAEFERRFELGLAQQIAEGGAYKGEGYDATAVTQVRFDAEGRVWRLTLPREEFPDAYLAKAEAVWLRDRALQSDR